MCECLSENVGETYRAYVGTYFGIVPVYSGARGDVVVKALRYKPAGRGYDWNFSVT